MKRALTAVTAACALILAGCGSTPTSTHPTITAKPPATPPARVCSGLTDKCVTPGLSSMPDVARSTGACHGLIPDVSDWQRHVDWKAAAACGVAGGIFKGGEGTSVDPYASDNASQLASLHLWHAMYWYIRNVGCSTEANDIAVEAHKVGVKVVVNDLETAADNVGYGSCLPALEKKAGLVPVDYTSPGTWSSSDGGFGAVPLWQAEYGPSLHPLWNPVVAWQCTDGHYGCVTGIPGIGYDDVSRDLGITKLGFPGVPKPKVPQCFTRHPDLKNKTCQHVRHQVNVWWGQLHYSIRRLQAKGCVLVWVSKADHQVLTGLKTGPLCTRIRDNAARERTLIDTTWVKYGGTLKK